MVTLNVSKCFYTLLHLIFLGNPITKTNSFHFFQMKNQALGGLNDLARMIWLVSFKRSKYAIHKCRTQPVLYIQA